MNCRKLLQTSAALMALGALLAGCGPSREQIMMAQALSARVVANADYNASARFLRTYANKHDKDYVMWSMEYNSLCLMGGNYEEAKAELLRCHADIEKRQDKDKETAAALGDESMKVFKGEPFERAMVCTYLGLLHYMEGDYNNARIFLTRADMADSTTADNMKQYRDDFRLAHFWLGKAFLKLGKDGNARVAFQKARERIGRKNEAREWKAIQREQARAREKRIRLEKKSFELATQGKEPVAGAVDMSASPDISEMPAVLAAAGAGEAAEDVVLRRASSLDEFASIDFQRDVNLILVIEVGTAPWKYLVGENQCSDAIQRAPYAERGVMVYLNGQCAGTAWQMLDMFHQADTRGTTEKDAAQLAKGITQSVLRRLPYVGSVAAYWNVKADHRYWRLLPGEAHVFAAKVKPGDYTISLRCFDANGKLLPRYRLTRHHIPVRAGQESIYLLHTYWEADNTYVPPKK